MKIGDSVACIKDMGDDSYSSELLFFKKGDIYRVTEVVKPGVYVIRGRSFGFYFSIIRGWTKSNPGYHYFDEYFINLKVSRKEKLKNINNVAL